MVNLQKDNFRYERKFFVTNVNRQQVERCILNHKNFFTEIYHERVVNNIYFDYPLLNNFMDNIEGNMNRIKYRIRWYGGMYDRTEKPILELKIKKGYVGTKRLFPLNPFQLHQGMDSGIIQKLIKNSKIDPEIKLNLKNQSPQILNQYRRKYFQSANKKFRITIDDNQTFFKINRLENHFLEKFDDKENIIIELKYDRKYDIEANQVTQSLPFMLTKSSKYSRAIEVLYFNQHI